jgi:poly(3-hydroxybutyrate) depolymerase
MASVPLFAPGDLSVLCPLVVALHGGGRDGASQIELWKPTAEREKVFVMAPSSLNQWWTDARDRQNLADTVNRLILNNSSIDRKRIYFFGHSLGGTIAFFDGFANRNALAALALHSPTGASGIYQLPQEGTRRLPVGAWVGDENFDSNWHTASALRFAYKEHPNLAIDLRVLPDHRHNDVYTRLGLVDEIWSFLNQYSL